MKRCLGCPTVAATAPTSGFEEAIEIRLEERETVEAGEDGAVRSLYGIEGPRRRPSDGPRSSVSELWRGESDEVADRRHAAGHAADLEARFDALRIELEAALDRRIRVAVDQMQITFDKEIEALRTLNREEAKRIRSSNDEAFVRVKVSNSKELERIRAAIDEGIARLCSVIEGQLDRVWSANDGELERIRSAGADRLAEVHDLLSDQLEQIRAAQPAAIPEDARAGDDPTITRRWLRRRRTPAAH